MSKRILSLVLAVVLAFGVSVGASAATTYGVFEGYAVTVLDTTTIATGGFYTGTPEMYYFHSTDSTVLGSISGENARTIQTKYFRDGLAPDGFGEDRGGWFAEQFNIYRGLAAGAGVATAELDRQTKMAEYRQEVVRLVNIERENAGLDPLQINENGMAFAQIRAEELTVLYSHQRPDGSMAAAENIAMGKYSPQQVVNAWMASDAHRENIMRNYTHVGVGCYISPAGNYYWCLKFVHENYVLV